MLYIFITSTFDSILLLVYAEVEDIIEDILHLQDCFYTFIIRNNYFIVQAGSKQIPIKLHIQLT